LPSSFNVTCSGSSCTVILSMRFADAFEPKGNICAERHGTPSRFTNV
jgi:hypothetical protein